MDAKVSIVFPENVDAGLLWGILISLLNSKLPSSNISPTMKNNGKSLLLPFMTLKNVCLTG